MPKNESILNAANTIWKLTREKQIRQQLEQQAQQLNRQTEQLNQQTLTLIGQIRIFSGENYSSEKCASMLMADIAVVKAVYAKIQESPNIDDASVLASLKGDGLTSHCVLHFPTPSL